MRFLVLGPLGVERAGRVRTVRGRREQALLGGLLAHRNEVVPAARLARFVWGLDGEPSRNAVQARVSHLRRSLGLEPDRLVFDGDGYRLRVGADESDDESLADAVGRAQALLGAGHGGAAEEVVTAALATVRGEPYGSLGDHPAILAAVARCRELIWSARELAARAALEAGDAAAAAARASALVADQPLRQEARVVLMRALDAQGRRAEALASYEEGRRLLAAETGLDPSASLRAAHAEILHSERTQARAAAAGPGVLEPPEMIRWLGDNGHLDAALRLAVRCAWGWWLAGDRGRGRRLLTGLLEQAARSSAPGPPDTRAARLWAAALAGHERDEQAALADADRTVAERPGFGTDHSEVEALALVLLAERRTERGEHAAAGRLLEPAMTVLRAAGDRWGLALGGLVTARGLLLRGEVDSGEQRCREVLAEFHDLSDPAGQLAALDLLGYAAEVRGDWGGAIEQHQRALLLAMHGGWPHTQCWQLIRLGTVMTIADASDAGRHRLAEALAVARRLESPSLTAFAHNSIALADARIGDRDAAARGHRHALAWYRAAGSLSGIALTAAALARVGPVDDAPALLAESWRAALATRDPRALAFTAESRALDAGLTARGAREMGLADALRAHARRPRVPGEQPAVDALADRLAAVHRLAPDRAAGERAGRDLASRLGAQPVDLPVTG